MQRRNFISRTLKTTGGIMIASSLPAFNIISRSKNNNGKLGIALVGLGNYAEHQLAPALQKTSGCYLAGIVTGTPEKEEKWAKKYDIPERSIYNYDNFDEIASNKDIDIVYVVLPNSMHAEFSIRAAEAGKHVICEKPMAVSVEECQAMIAASNKAGKKLSIGYRLHFDPYNLRMMELGQNKKYGKIREVSAGFAFHSRDPNAWRMKKDLAGGGPLMDLGVYALQGCIYTVGELPVQVTAKDTTQKTDFFTEVEGTIEWELEFPSGFKGVCKTSYEDQYNYLKCDASEGTFELDPAYSYGGIKGKTPGGDMKFDNVNQQALQMDGFVNCIRNGMECIVPGEMGLRDLYIMEAIYEAAETGRPVSLKDIPNILHVRSEG